MSKKHLGVSALMGKVYYGRISADGMGWLSDKVEIPKSEFIQAIFDWVKIESKGSNVVDITRFEGEKAVPFACITIAYSAETAQKMETGGSENNALTEYDELDGGATEAMGTAE